MHRTQAILPMLVLAFCALAVSCYDKAPIVSAASCGQEADCMEVDSKARILKDHLPGARIAFNAIQVFGDSLSDIGRYHRYTKGLVFPESIYWKGRAADGPLWIDYAVGALGVRAYNYAFAGAPTRPPKFPYQLIFPSLQDQIEEFNEYRGSQPQSTALAILWIGGNNYIYSGRRTDVVNYTLADIKANSEKILASGVQGLILVNLPDLAAIEYLPKDFSREEYKARLKNFSEEHNQKLPGVMEELRTQYPGRKISLMDVHAAGQNLRNQKEQLGFCDFTQPCYRGEFFSISGKAKDVCIDPDAHWNWDAVHPTTRVHCYYAVQFFSSLHEMGLLDVFSKTTALQACMPAHRKTCP